MKGSTYKGDSPGKKLMRYRAWTALQQLSQDLRLPFHGALVLAGEGGDLQVLKGLGCDMSKVTAVDRDKFLVDYCKDGFPEVNCVHGELSDIASSGIPFNTAHIDYCGSLSVDNVITTARVCHAVHSHPALVAVTMQKGREQMGRSGLMGGVKRVHRRRLQKEARKRKNVFAEHVFSNRKFNPQLALEEERKRMLKNFMLDLREYHKGEWSPHMKLLFRSDWKPGLLGTGLIRCTAMMRVAELLWDAWGLLDLPFWNRYRRRDALCNCNISCIQKEPA